MKEGRRRDSVESWGCLPLSLGYPVLRQRVEFKKGGRCANQEDWNKFITAMKVSRSTMFPSDHKPLRSLPQGNT